MTNTLFFVDGGITGTTMKRPGFQKMIQAIENGYISAVFVKDLSRLGRNYIEVGRLTEKLGLFARRVPLKKVWYEVDAGVKMGTKKGRSNELPQPFRVSLFERFYDRLRKDAIKDCKRLF